MSCSESYTVNGEQVEWSKIVTKEVSIFRAHIVTPHKPTTDEMYQLFQLGADTVNGINRSALM